MNCLTASSDLAGVGIGRRSRDDWKKVRGFASRARSITRELLCGTRPISYEEAEAFLDSQLQEMIEGSGLQELINYSRVEVSSLRGRVRFFDVSFTSANPHFRLAVAELRVQMAPDDLYRLARDRETATLSGLRVSMLSVAAADEARGTELEFSEISADFTGHLPLETLDRPDTMRLSELEPLLEGMSFTDSASGFRGRIANAGYTITGELSVADFQREPQEILPRLEAMETRIKRAGFELSGPRAGARGVSIDSGRVWLARGARKLGG